MRDDSLKLLSYFTLSIRTDFLLTLMENVLHATPQDLNSLLFFLSEFGDD